MAEQDTSLDQLRQQIDEVDTALVGLLARRKRLVAEVGESKLRAGVPVYVPEREAALLTARRAEAEKQGISPDLVEDLLRRIMRESYAAEGSAGFKGVHPDVGPVVIIGGGGGMGSIFLRMFSQSGYQVRQLEHNDWDRADELLNDAGVVLVSVPINKTVGVIEKLAGRIPDDCILADLTSIKAIPMRKMLTVHGGPVVGLHPMFGPSTRFFAKQLIVYCQGRHPERYTWLLQQLDLWGANLLEAEPEQHDHLMGSIQAMRHFATYVYGVHLFKEGVDLEELLAFSSPIYRLELGMVGRLFAQDPNLYADIIFSSVEGGEIADRYQRRFEQELAMLREGKKEAFLERFSEVAVWFGSHGQQFIRESSFMLEKMYERFGDRTERQRLDN